MKNQVHIAFKEEDATLEDGVWTVPHVKTRTLYDGRYCAVAGFVYAVVDGKYSVLANVRGPGCPDYRGFWNCPCGYLERDEDGVDGIIREIWEECGVKVRREQVKFRGAQTNPVTSNQGNVTLRYSAFLGSLLDWEDAVPMGGEDEEVTDIRWIPVQDVKNYSWAFGHLNLIKKYAHPRIIQRLLEIFCIG